MASSSRGLPEGRPYQGYPYVNPMVIDVPTINAATAAKWANLPRRPISRHPLQNTVANENIPSEPSTSSQVSRDTRQPSRLQVPTESEQDAENAPIVYIELPEPTGTTGSNRDMERNLPEGSGEDNLSFVEDTIFYDPFENRQIDINRPKEAPVAVENEETVTSATLRPAPDVPSPCSPSTPGASPYRPTPPNTLAIYPSFNSNQSTPTLPAYSLNSPHIYRPASIEDGFTLTPLPVNDYERPPPSYTEVIGATPPPVEVIVDQPTVGLPGSVRKLTTCQQCGLRVNTLVTREIGIITHIIALMPMIICLFPFTILIYCTDYLKNRVHYCPNCNFKIGKEPPCSCGVMKYYKI